MAVNAGAPRFDEALYDHSQSLLLLAAAAQKDPETLRMALEKGADPNTCDPEGCTALYTCTGNGFLEGVSQLLQYGAHLDLANSDGFTAM